MTSADLKTIFETNYNREDWRNALQDIFHIKSLHAKPHPVDLGANDFDARAVELGYFETAEGLQVGLYEVIITPEKRLDRNKVGLRNLMRKVYQNDGDAALIVFTQGPTWRFTYASELTVVNIETGLRERKQTDAKRYTYVLGHNRHCRTAIERFSGLKSSQDLFNDSKISIQEIEKAFSVETLTKQFYKELFDWFQWALSDTDGFAVTFPNDTSIVTDDRKIDEHIIRLITRLMFVWFIKQKSLIPEEIFNKSKLKGILKDFEPGSKTKGNYYNAILQNLFFATLNKAIEERAFTKDGDYNNRKEHYGIKSFFRNPKGGSWFNISNDEILKLFSTVPFLNGGLFECLDKEQDSNGKIIYHDGFSREAGRQRRAFIPNCLFFDAGKGLIPLLEKYNFTIEESTPIDVEVALDPELLGKVFENLLGAFNPETKETARKQSGSFYTPREIVNYMVDESLIAYLNTKCPEVEEDKLRMLFIADNDTLKFNETERFSLISGLKSVKILDPACGSGAFPMGVLNRMVNLLQKLDDEEASTPYEQKLHLIENCIYGIDIQTIAVQISKLRFFISLVSEQVTNTDPSLNYGIIPLPNLETKFVAANTLIGLQKDFTDRLDLGYTEIRELKDQLWDIRSKHFSARNATEKQSLRKQDEKLRMSIQTLLVNLTSKPDTAKVERLQADIRILETEIELFKGENWVDITDPQVKQGVLFDLPSQNEQLTFKIDKNKEERNRINKRIKEKQKEIEKENNKATHAGFEKNAEQLSKWDPYDQNTSSPFFDAEWMFNSKEGFDVLIGNPPYISAVSMARDENQKKYFKIIYPEATGSYDIYILFLLRTIELLSKFGTYSFIIPNKFLIADYANLTKLKLLENGLKFSIDVSTFEVFENTSVYPIIILGCKTNQSSFQEYLIQEYKDLELRKFHEPISLRQHKIFSDFNIKFASGATGFEAESLKQLLSNKFTKNSIPFVVSGCIDRFQYTNRNVRFMGDKFEEAFITHSKTIAPSKWKFWMNPKIVIAGMTKVIESVFVEEPLALGVGVYAIHSFGNFDPRFLSAVLNSKYLTYYINIRFKDKHLAGGYLAINKSTLENLPLVLPSDYVYFKIIECYNRLRNYRNSVQLDDITSIERQIDEMVFKMYDLTYDEVKVIDPDFWLSEEEYEKVKVE